MIFATTYKIKPFLTKAETTELMGVFATAGAAPGTIAHYVAADGSQGLVISESDDIEAAYRNILSYAAWVQFDTKVMLKIEQAVPHIMSALA